MRDLFKKLRWWSLFKLFKEENEPSSLEIRSVSKSKLGKKCIELGPKVILIGKTLLIFLMSSR